MLSNSGPLGHMLIRLLLGGMTKSLSLSAYDNSLHAVGKKDR